MTIHVATLNKVLPYMQIREHYQANAKGASAKGANTLHTVSKGCQPRINPSMIIECINKSLPPPIISYDHLYSRSLLAKHSLSVLGHAQCAWTY